MSVKNTLIAAMTALSLISLPAYAWWWNGQATNSGTVIPPGSVTLVTLTPPNGALTTGGTAEFDVSFDTTVNVAGGTPTLQTNIPNAIAPYVSGSGTNKLRFHFIAASGQNTPDLRPAVSGAIALNGATIRNQSNGNASLTGADAYDPSGVLVIDTTPPVVNTVVLSGNGITNGNGSVVVGTAITFTLTFSENVNLVSGPPSLSLNNGGSASYVGGGGTSSLTFSYTVTSGQDVAALAVTAFNLNGGTLRDDATNATNTGGAVGQFGNVVVGTGGVVTFSTNFPATENPISQTQQWRNGCTVSTSWGCIQTTGNLAFGTSQSSEFGNDIAILSGTWLPNQTAQAKIKVNPQPGPYVEANLRLNTTISANSITGYDIVCSVSSAQYLQINKWNGPLAPAGNPNNDFTNLISTATSCANNDILKAENNNGQISVYINDMVNPVLTTFDTTYTNGAPGIEIKNNNVQPFGTAFGSGVGFLDFTATARAATVAPSIVTASGPNISNGSGSVVTGDVVQLTVNFPNPVFVSVPAASCATGTFYVSNSGSDSNNGTTTGTPWQTINKVNNAHLDAGNCVKFNGGQTFADRCLRISPGTNVFSSSATNPIVIGSYGSGRATLDGASDCAGGTALAGVLLGSGNATLRGITFQDLILRNSAHRDILDGINVYGPIDTVLIQNVDISGYNVGVPGGANASHIVVDGSGVNNVKIFGNKFHGENVMSDDQNAVYAHGGATNIQISGNEIFNMGGTPQNAVFGTLGIADVHDLNGANRISYNLIHDIGSKAFACGGSSGIEEIQESGVVIEFNEIYRIQPIGAYSGCDWDAIDLDGGGVTDSFVQYNYVHDNFGTGLYGCVACYGDQAWTRNVYRYNIAVNNGKPGSGAKGGIAFQGNSNPPNNTIQVYNNVIYNEHWGPAVFNTMQSGGVFANNIIATTDDFPFVECNNFPIYNTLYRNNAYVNLSGNSSFTVQNCAGANSYNTIQGWKSATGDTTSFFTSTKPWSGSTPTGTCPSWLGSSQGPQPCPSQFVLSTNASAFIGTGLNLTQSPYNLNVGTRDYYGNSIPHGVGTGYNIGADGTGAGSTPPPTGGGGGGGTPPVDPPPPSGPFVGPLDTVGGTVTVAACYSTRACSVSAANAGVNAYQLARASDGTTLNIPLLATGKANEASAAAFCGGTTCQINKWYDQTGHSGNDVFPVDQAGTIINTRRPNWIPSCLNGVACLQFAEVNVSDDNIKMLATSNFTPNDNTQPYSVSYVARYESVFNNDQFIVGTSEFATKTGVGHSAGGGYMIEVMENKFTVPVPDDAFWRNVQNTIDGNNSSISVDGVRSTGATLPSSGQWAGLVARFQIGSTKDDGYILYGKMAEVIVFGHTALDSTQHTNLCHNQRLFFGTGGSC